MAGVGHVALDEALRFELLIQVLEQPADFFLRRSEPPEPDHAGSEIRKTHPAVILRNDATNRDLARVVVVPLTSSTGRQYPGEALVTVGGQNSKAMADQIMAAYKARLKNQMVESSLSG